MGAPFTTFFHFGLSWAPKLHCVLFMFIHERELKCWLFGLFCLESLQSAFFSFPFQNSFPPALFVFTLFCFHLSRQFVGLHGMSPGLPVLGGDDRWWGCCDPGGTGKYGDTLCTVPCFSWSLMVKKFTRLGKRFYLLFGKEAACKNNPKAIPLSILYSQS